MDDCSAEAAGVATLRADSLGGVSAVAAPPMTRDGHTLACKVFCLSGVLAQVSSKSHSADDTVSVCAVRRVQSHWRFESLSGDQHSR